METEGQQSGRSPGTLLLGDRRDEVESEKELSRGSREMGGNKGARGHPGARQGSNAQGGERGASAGFRNVWVTAFLWREGQV